MLSRFDFNEHALKKSFLGTGRGYGVSTHKLVYITTVGKGDLNFEISLDSARHGETYKGLYCNLCDGQSFAMQQRLICSLPLVIYAEEIPVSCQLLSHRPMIWAITQDAIENRNLYRLFFLPRCQTRS